MNDDDAQYFYDRNYNRITVKNIKIRRDLSAMKNLCCMHMHANAYVINDNRKYLFNVEP